MLVSVQQSLWIMQVDPSKFVGQAAEYCSTAGHVLDTAIADGKAEGHACVSMQGHISIMLSFSSPVLFFTCGQSYSSKGSQAD